MDAGGSRSCERTGGEEGARKATGECVWWMPVGGARDGTKASRWGRV